MSRVPSAPRICIPILLLVPPRWIGHHTSLSLRDRARDALADCFDIRDFRRAVLKQVMVALFALGRIADESIESTRDAGKAMDS